MIDASKFMFAWLELRKYVDEVSEIDPDGSIPVYQVRQVMNRLLPLPVRVYNPAVEWVPVSSGQVPEKPGHYEVTVGSPLRYVTTIFLGQREIEKKDISFTTEQAIAWKNLPEPYRGEG